MISYFKVHQTFKSCFNQFSYFHFLFSITIRIVVIIFFMGTIGVCSFVEANDILWWNGKSNFVNCPPMFESELSSSIQRPVNTIIDRASGCFDHITNFMVKGDQLVNESIFCRIKNIFSHKANCLPLITNSNDNCSKNTNKADNDSTDFKTSHFNRLLFKIGCVIFMIGGIIAMILSIQNYLELKSLNKMLLYLERCKKNGNEN